MTSEISQGQFSSDLVTDVLLTIVVTIGATTAIYLTFVLLIRVLGTRTLANLSTFDFACMVAVGAVIGRTAVLAHPNLLTGVVALITLFALQGTLGFIRARERGNRWVNPRPVVLARDGVIDHDALRRVHLVEDELRFAVRRAGLPGLAAIGLVVLEANGTISVVRASHRDEWIEADLPGAQAAGSAAGSAVGSAAGSASLEG